VGNIKQASEFARCQMFFYNSWPIIQGHLPPAEINQVSAMAFVPPMEDSLSYYLIHFGLLIDEDGAICCLKLTLKA
jgi:hypothetical protein